MKKIIILGSSGHAKVVADVIESEGKYEIAGFVDSFQEKNAITLGYRNLGSQEELPVIVAKHDIAGAIVAIGDNYVRSKVADRVRALCPNLPFVKAIHPRAAVARKVKIGAGTVIMAGVTVNIDSLIGDFCILNTNSSLDHDSVMAAYSSLAPGARLGGRCQLGEFSAIGIGAILIHKVRIGDHTVVGAGSLVLDTITSHVVAYGSPAEVARSRKPGERYLSVHGEGREQRVVVLISSSGLSRYERSFLFNEKLRHSRNCVDSKNTSGRVGHF